MGLRLQLLSASSAKKELLDFLEGSDGTFFHNPLWVEFVSRFYAYEDLSLAAFEGEELVAFMPLALAQDLKLRTRLVSFPFSDYGGFAFSSGASDGAKKEACLSASRLLAKASAEVRVPAGLSPLYASPESRMEYSTFVLDLAKVGSGYLSALPQRIRRVIKKHGQRFEVRECRSMRELESAYYLYLLNCKKYGSPAHPFSFFEQLHEKFSAKGMLSIKLLLGEEPAAFIACLSWRDTVHYWLGGFNPKLRRFSPFTVLLYEAILDAKERGFSYFDFGRTRRGTGLFFYKSGWGGEERAIHHLFYGGAKPVDPLIPLFSALSKAYKLVPWQVNCRIGKELVRRVAL